MKVLQPYKDWLLLNRGEIKPKIGDKYCCYNEEGLFIKGEILPEHNINSDISSLYVEIDYNPNEAIEFATWINSKMEWNFNNEYKEIKELYKQFKDEK